MPITATVMAVRAAIGLMVCIAVNEVAKNIVKVTSETTITSVPMARFL